MGDIRNDIRIDKMAVLVGGPMETLACSVETKCCLQWFKHGAAI